MLGTHILYIFLIEQNPVNLYINMYSFKYPGFLELVSEV